ncbi:MAG TPA: VWA domain-containing protein, partial [Saliniramus sp.]|nr:VWA domain-containing protein [Saliniramus sp.]
FKHFEHFYFHNCPYEGVWKDNRRRRTEITPTLDVIRTYGEDYRLVFVGDAAMSPYEIVMAGGSVEHWNEEPGQLWMERLLGHFHKAAWLNPVPEAHWGYTHSIGIVRQLMEGRMFALTVEGLDRAMKALS